MWIKKSTYESMYDNNFIENLRIFICLTKYNESRLAIRKCKFYLTTFNIKNIFNAF